MYKLIHNLETIREYFEDHFEGTSEHNMLILVDASIEMIYKMMDEEEGNAEIDEEFEEQFINDFINRWSKEDN